MQSGSISAGRFAVLMRQMGGFYAMLDPVMVSASERLAPDGYRYRTRASHFSSRNPAPIRPPRVETLPALAGAAYVVDGAVMGGQIIARALPKDLQHPYWTWCTRDGPTQWRSVLGLIAAVDSSERAAQEAVDTALATFEAFSAAVAEPEVETLQ